TVSRRRSRWWRPSARSGRCRASRCRELAASSYAHSRCRGGVRTDATQGDSLQGQARSRPQNRHLGVLNTAAPPLPAMSTPRVVHLELHTDDLAAACAFYSELLGWRTEQIDNHSGTYHALRLGGGLDGGIVACGTRRAGWLPYVEVDRIEAATE